MDHGNMSVMAWQPPLLRLTQCVHPDTDGGVAGPCFVAPQHIMCIMRVNLVHHKSPYKGGEEQEYYAGVSATSISLSPSLSMNVIESPEVVASMRDRALGFGPKLESAK